MRNKLFLVNTTLIQMSKRCKSKGMLGTQVDTSAKMKETEPISLNKNNEVLIQIYAKPGAKQNVITGKRIHNMWLFNFLRLKIAGITSEGINVQINASPIEGAANSELIKYVAAILGVRSSKVSLENGHKSRFKTLKISGNAVLDDVKMKINQEIN